MLIAKFVKIIGTEILTGSAYAPVGDFLSGGGGTYSRIEGALYKKVYGSEALACIAAAAPVGYKEYSRGDADITYVEVGVV